MRDVCWFTRVGRINYFLRSTAVSDPSLFKKMNDNGSFLLKFLITTRGKTNFRKYTPELCAAIVKNFSKSNKPTDY